MIFRILYKTYRDGLDGVETEIVRWLDLRNNRNSSGKLLPPST